VRPINAVAHIRRARAVRPYINHDDSVKMVRHDDIRIDRQFGADFRRPSPFLTNDFPEFIQPRRPVDDIAEQTCTVMRTYGHEIRAGAGVIETGQTDGAADGGGQGTLLAGGFVPRPYMLNA